MQSSAICLLISQTAKGGNGMTAIAGQFLTVVLEDLKYNRNLKMNLVTQTVTIPAASNGPFNLEADYLRTYDFSYPLQTPSGETQFLTPITLEQYDAEFKGTQTADYPYEFATDLSTQAQTASGAAGQYYVYPQSNAAISATHRYFKNQPDITTPETSSTVPWFPFTEYLITAAAAGMMGVTGDDRKEEFHARAERMLAPYLIMQGDEQSTVKDIKLDPRRFRQGRYARPIKTMPF